MINIISRDSEGGYAFTVEGEPGDRAEDVDIEIKRLHKLYPVPPVKEDVRYGLSAQGKYTYEIKAATGMRAKEIERELLGIS